MGLLDRLFGRTAGSAGAGQPQYTPMGGQRPGYDQGYQQPTAQGGQAAGQQRPARTADEQAIARYKYLLRTAPPEAVEQAHAEAFAQLTPDQRRQVLAQMSQDLPASERPTADDPATLARTATRAEMRQPGYMMRTFGTGMGGYGGGMGGGMSMGRVIGGSMLGTIAGVVIGTAVADMFMDGFDAWDNDHDLYGDDFSDNGDNGDGGNDGGDQGESFADGGDQGGFDGAQDVGSDGGFDMGGGTGFDSGAGFGGFDGGDSFGGVDGGGFDGGFDSF